MISLNVKLIVSALLFLLTGARAATECISGQPNPFDEACSCEGQFFMGDLCKSALFCESDNTGCLLECAAGSVVQVDHATQEMVCVPEDDEPFCTGIYNTNCEATVDEDLNSDMCKCQGELIYSGDCRQAFYCDERYPRFGGKHVYCGEDQMVDLELPFWEYTCVDFDASKCPGTGNGYGVGCDGGANVNGPPMPCRHTFSENPLGACNSCEGQLFMNEDCSQGFYCSDAVPLDQPETEGCYLECPAGYRVYINEYYSQFLCLPKADDYMCPGKFNLECPSGSGSDLDIECGCSNEIWVSEDCSTGFRCSAPETPQGETLGDYFSCEAGTVIEVDFTYPVSFKCVTQVSTCIGAYHMGCDGGDFGQFNNTITNPPTIQDTTTEMLTTTEEVMTTEKLVMVTECTTGQPNPFDEACSCKGQFFMGDLCTLALFCESNNTGCLLECAAGSVVQVDHATQEMVCVPEDDEPFCTGIYNTNCEATVDEDLNSDMCKCQGELIYSGDCKQAFYCDERYPRFGGKHVYCGEDQMVDLELPFWEYTCVDFDASKCPGTGNGYGVGCDGGANVNGPPMPCRHIFSANPLGACNSCEGQLFMNEDCSQGFYCSDAVPLDQPETEGCYLECPAGYRVYVNEYYSQFLCLPKADDYMCPGKFNLECPSGSGSDLDIECGCSNEIWVSEDCSTGFRCSAPETSQGETLGDYFSCEAGTVIEVDFTFPVSFKCATQVSTCIGAYHMGCDGGDFGQFNNTITNPPTVQDTTTEMLTTTEEDMTTEKLVTTEMVITTEEVVTTEKVMTTEKLETTEKIGDLVTSTTTEGEVGVTEPAPSKVSGLKCTSGMLVALLTVIAFTSS